MHFCSYKKYNSAFQTLLECFVLYVLYCCVIYARPCMINCIWGLKTTYTIAKWSHLISHAWAPPSCEEWEASEKFKMKIYFSTRIEPASSCFPSRGKRPLGQFERSWAVVKTLTLSQHVNKINMCYNTWIKFIMFWCIHAKFCIL